MTETKFVGRQTELRLLDNLWQSDKATLMILYGRRRIGKTRLLTHWLRAGEERGLYWVAEATSAPEQLRAFTQAIYQFESPNAPEVENYSFASWEQAFHHVAHMAQNKRIALVIDEVTYLIMANPDFVTILQNAWDRWLKQSKVMLVLSGSHVGLMEKKILSYDAPLYGRDTARTQLSPLPFWTTERFFPNYTVEERIIMYSIFGGIPAYWERFDPGISVWDNIRFQLMPSSSWLLDEPQFLLRDFFSDTLNYVSILRAIGRGAHTQGKIVSYSGLPQTHVSSYLNTLRDAGFVTREVPVTEPNPSRSRRGRYHITDPYLRFFYRFLATHQSRLALGGQERFFESLRQDLPKFIEEYAWQQLCGDWLLLAADKGEIPLSIEKTGGFWHRSKAIELVGIDRVKRNLVLATCHWSETQAGLGLLQDLIKKTATVVPKSTHSNDDEEEKLPNHWHVFFIGFSAVGWEPKIKDRAEKILQTSQQNANWRTVGIRLVDLPTVNQNLQQWLSQGEAL